MKKLSRRNRLIIGRTLMFPHFTGPEERTSLLALGSSQSGKTTSALMSNVLNWLGPCVCVSTKSSELAESIGVRRQLGECTVLDLRSTVHDLPFGVKRVRFSPINGCGDWQFALEMASQMIGALSTDGATAEFFASRARSILAPSLHASALEQLPLSRMISELRGQNPHLLMHILAKHRAHEAHRMLSEVMLYADPRQRGDSVATVMSALDGYSGNLLAEADLALPGELDGSAFIHSADYPTLYVISPLDGRGLGPVVVAVVASLYRAIRVHSDRHGPLAVPCLVCVDELSQVGLPDLPAYLSESAGRGCQWLLCVQDWAQMEARYSPASAKAMLSNVRYKLIYPGLANADTLALLSSLAGTHWIPRPGARNGEMTEAQVWSPQAIAHLRRGQVLCFTPRGPHLYEAAHYRRTWPVARWHAIARRAES